MVKAWIVKWPEPGYWGDYFKEYMDPQKYFALWTRSQREAMRYHSREEAQAVCDGWGPNRKRPIVVRLIPKRS